MFKLILLITVLSNGVTVEFAVDSNYQSLTACEQAYQDVEPIAIASIWQHYHTRRDEGYTLTHECRRGA